MLIFGCNILFWDLGTDCAAAARGAKLKLTVYQDSLVFVVVCSFKAPRTELDRRYINAYYYYYIIIIIIIKSNPRPKPWP